MTDKALEPVELLGCPFCGGEAIFEEASESAFGCFSIICRSCPEPLRPMHSISQDRKECIAAWNTRAQPLPDLEKLAERIERLLPAIEADGHLTCSRLVRRLIEDIEKVAKQ